MRVRYESEITRFLLFPARENFPQQIPLLKKIPFPLLTNSSSRGEGEVWNLSYILRKVTNLVMRLQCTISAKWTCRHFKAYAADCKNTATDHRCAWEMWGKADCFLEKSFVFCRTFQKKVNNWNSQPLSMRCSFCFFFWFSFSQTGCSLNQNTVDPKIDTWTI